MAESIPQSVGVIGVGAMGGSIARGLVEAGVLDASHLLVADSDERRVSAFAKMGARVFADGAALLADAPDVVILAVKPQVLGGVMADQ